MGGSGGPMAFPMILKGGLPPPPPISSHACTTLDALH